jgi:hypothetical protein
MVFAIEVLPDIRALVASQPPQEFLSWLASYRCYDLRYRNPDIRCCLLTPFGEHVRYVLLL